MTEVLHADFDRPGRQAADQPYLDTTAYGSGPDDSITDVTEAAAITHHVATVGGVSIAYTAKAGHLVAVDPVSSKPSAKFFYVAFTRDGAAAEHAPGDLLLQRGPGLLGGVPAARLVRPAPHQDEHARLHAAAALHDGGQSRQPHRQQRPRLHQSGRNGLFLGGRAVQEPRLLGRRSGRALDQAVHQAIPDRQRPLELAEVPVRGILRHRAQLRARLDASRGRDRSQRPHATVERSRLPREFQQRRRAHADLRRGRMVSPQDRRQPSAAEPAGVHGHGDPVLLGRLCEGARRLSQSGPGDRPDAVSVSGNPGERARSPGSSTSRPRTGSAIRCSWSRFCRTRGSRSAPTTAG